MNKERLQEYNEILSENNISLEDINNTINELPDVGNMMEKFEINDASYLFYKGARINALNEILKLCKDLTNMSQMFYQCQTLKEINLSNFDTSKVTDMSYMFYSCSILENVDLSNFSVENVTNLGYAFNNCQKLKSLDLSSFNTPKNTRLSFMFGYCSQLENLNISNFDTSEVTYMDGTFYNCQKLKSLDLSNFDFCKTNYISTFITNCTVLENLEFGVNLGKAYTQKRANYNQYTLSFNGTQNLTHDSLMDVINKLYDLNLTYDVANGGTLYTQQLILGADNLAKMTSEELNIVVQKGWVVS